MGLISGSGSFTRYIVEGELEPNFMGSLSERIAPYLFRNLDETSLDVRNMGWVNIMDMFDNRFSGLEFLKEPYIAMSLRIDERKIPQTALKQHCLEAENRIKEQENLEFLSRTRRSDIKEAVTLRLLKRAIPVARTYDMIWNYTTGFVLFGGANNKLCDEFVKFFLQTFEFHLQAVCPYTIGSRFLEKEGTSPDLLDGLNPSDFSEEK